MEERTETLEEKVQRELRTNLNMELKVRNLKLEHKKLDAKVQEIKTEKEQLAGVTLLRLRQLKDVIEKKIHLLEMILLHRDLIESEMDKITAKLCQERSELEHVKEKIRYYEVKLQK